MHLSLMYFIELVTGSSYNADKLNITVQSDLEENTCSDLKSMLEPNLDTILL